MKPPWKSQFILLGIACFMGLLLLLTITPTQASMEEVRIARLEADLFRLQNEVNQLSSQLYSLDRSSDRTPANSVEVPSLDRERTSSLANDPMFERLSTLVIELKQKIDGLEERLVKLEQ